MKHTNAKVIGFIDLSKFDEPKRKERATKPVVHTCVLCGRVKHTSECSCEVHNQY